MMSMQKKNGTKAKDAQVYLVEIDASYTFTYLNGSPRNSQGDWVTSNKHPIMDYQTNAKKIIL
jgi:hypothetical protein